jgi:hypothetical protein
VIRSTRTLIFPPFHKSGFQSNGHWLSVGNVKEFGLLTDYVEGESYSHDLERFRDTGRLVGVDHPRADALCDYLEEIHRVCGNDPGLYVRRIRELVGHGECIMGICGFLSSPSTCACEFA